MSETPAKNVRISRGAGRPRQPIEKRIARSSRPHLNRVGPPDEPFEVVANEEIPKRPPKEFSKYEKECWNMIRETQTGQGNARWIYRSDSAYLVATCALYGRWREVREELNRCRDMDLGYLDADSMKVNPLVATEANLLVKYQQSLISLGLVPTRRQVTPAEKPADETGLIAH